MASSISEKIIFVLLLFLSACSSLKYQAESINVNSSTPTDSSYYALIEPYQTSLEKEMNEVVGAAARDLVKKQPEGTLGNFVADLTLSTALDFQFKELPKKRTFCLLNHGGLRAPISKGPITVGNVYELMPFDNEIVIVKLSGAKVLELATYVAFYGGHPMSGIEINAVVNEKNKTAEVEIFIQGQAWDEQKDYYVITSDYLANGGDHMNFFKAPLSLSKSGVLLRDAILNYIKAQDSPIDATIEGRLKIDYDE